MKTTTARPTTLYLMREMVLILVFSYVVLAGGTINGMIRFRLRLISHVLIALVLLAWLVYRTCRRERLPRTPLDIPIVVFLAAHLLTTALSTDPRRSLGYVWLLLFYALYFYLWLDLLRHGWPAELVIKCLLIVGGILIGLAVVEIVIWYVGWMRLSYFLPPSTLRLHSILGDANMTSSFLNVLTPVALLRGVQARRWRIRLLLGVWLVAALVVQFFTSSRGGWLGTATVLGVSLLLLASVEREGIRDLWRRVSSKRWLPVPIGLATVLAVAGVALLALRQLHHPTHGGIIEARRAFWVSAWRAFLSSPLWGTGPMTYGSQLMKYESPLPWRPYPHAHSYPFTTAAESGLISLVVSGWLALAVAVALWQTWRRADRNHRLLMAGGVASVAGFAVHSLVDNHITVPAIALNLIVVLALALVDRSRTESAGRLPLAWLWMPALLLIGLACWSDGAYWPFIEGVKRANAEDWAGAVPLLDRAVQRDPGLAFYRLQSGYVYGVLASQEQEGEHLKRAIERYEEGLALEPYYPLNHANLAGLYWQAGRQEQAMGAMQRAAELAPQESLYRLNLGHYYELAGQKEEALAQYEEALALRPELAEAEYWRENAWRESFLARWREEQPPEPAPDPPLSYDDHVRRGGRDLENERPSEAVAAFQEALALDASRYEACYGLGKAYMALDELDQAAHYLTLALKVYHLQAETRMEPLLALGEVAHRQGRLGEAIAWYELALSMVHKRTIYGPGTWGWSPYGWFIFYRESIVPDMLPQLERADITADLARRFRELDEWYKEADAQ